MCATGKCVQCPPSVSLITGKLLTLFLLSEIAAANKTKLSYLNVSQIHERNQADSQFIFPPTHILAVCSHVINIGESLFTTILDYNYSEL
jgi:hypothetical protein